MSIFLSFFIFKRRFIFQRPAWFRVLVQVSLPAFARIPSPFPYSLGDSFPPLFFPNVLRDQDFLVWVEPLCPFDGPRSCIPPDLRLAHPSWLLQHPCHAIGCALTPPFAGFFSSRTQPISLFPVFSLRTSPGQGRFGRISLPPFFSFIARQTSALDENPLVLLFSCVRLSHVVFASPTIYWADVSQNISF